ncbi:MAG: serine hydrolase domain-containing protein [Steroidobacteraceae bacterium]
MRKKILIAAVTTSLALASWAIVANWAFLYRYTTFIAEGGDPHLIPVSWYQPQAIIHDGTGQNSPLPEGKPVGIAGELLQQVRQYALGEGGHALLIAQDGAIIYEEYAQGADRSMLVNPQSMSKSLMAIAVGIALKNGQLRDVEQPIGELLPNLAEDPRGRITIRHLLQMTGGLEQLATDYSPAPWSRGVQQHFGSRFNYWVLQLQPIDPPGQVFEYNNDETNLLGMALESATGMPYQDYLASVVWPLLGLGDARAYLDRAGGDIMKSCCIFSRPIDWLALGQLVLDGGQWQGQDVLQPGYATAMVSPSAANPDYGYLTWLAPLTLRGGYVGPVEPPTPLTWWASEAYAAPVYSFVGFGFHQTWIIPSLEMVVVRVNGRQWPAAAWDQSRIPNLLIRGLPPVQPAY